MQFVIVFLAVIIAAAVILLSRSKDAHPHGLAFHPSTGAILVGLFVIAAGVVASSAMVFVPFGTNDIVTFNGALTDRILMPGLNFKIPIVNGVYPMNVQMRALVISTSSVFTRDQQNANNDYVINFSLDDNHLKDIASQFKGDDGRDTSISEKLIQPRAEFYLKQIEPKYDAASLLTHRADVATALQKSLDHDVKAYGVRVAFVSITNISFGAHYQQSSEERAAAEQEYQKELIVLKTKKVIADQLVATANGQARANDELRASFGSDPRTADALVRMRMIELLNDRWKGDMPTALGSGSLLSISETGTAQK